MDKNKNKRRLGLLVLYLLLLTVSSLIRQVKYYGLPAILLIAISIIVLVILWMYLLRNNIISVTWASLTYEPNGHKSERVFLFSLVTLVAPVLRFYDITNYDLIVSGVVISVGVIGFIANENRLNKKKQSSK